FIEDNHELVWRRLDRYAPADTDDVVSTGAEALLRAARTFTPGKGAQPRTYARRCIDRARVDLMRKRYGRLYRGGALLPGMAPLPNEARPTRPEAEAVLAANPALWEGRTLEELAGTDGRRFRDGVEPLDRGTDGQRLRETALRRRFRPR